MNKVDNSRSKKNLVVKLLELIQTHKILTFTDK